MQGFVIICLCATVLGVPQGYQYNQQQNEFSIGLPNLGVNNQIATATKTQQQQGHGFLQQIVNTGNLQHTLLEGQKSIQNTQQFFQHATPQQVFGFNNIQQQQQVPIISNVGGEQQQQKLNRFQQHYQVPGTITKDIYVHVAPEDAQEQRYQQPTLPVPPPRKHYRIVFIKAPSQSSNNAALRIQQAPTEEKTIIYVLTKKTDPLDLHNALQEVQPRQPSKPEVYFIKYKTQEEAQHAQRTIQAQYDQLGGTSQVSDEGVAPVASVIGTLNGSQHQTALDFSKGSGHLSSSSSTSSSSPSFTSSGSASNGNKYLPPIVKL